MKLGSQDGWGRLAGHRLRKGGAWERPLKAPLPGGAHALVGGLVIHWTGQWGSGGSLRRTTGGGGAAGGRAWEAAQGQAQLLTGKVKAALCLRPQLPRRGRDRGSHQLWAWPRSGLQQDTRACPGCSKRPLQGSERISRSGDVRRKSGETKASGETPENSGETSDRRL